LPEGLRKAFLCRRWKCLPRAGGLDNQSVRVMNEMSVAESVYEAMHAYNAADKAGIANDEKWMRANAHTMKIWARVQILRSHDRLQHSADS
jgi:hypothetical protein